MVPQIFTNLIIFIINEFFLFSTTDFIEKIYLYKMNRKQNIKNVTLSLALLAFGWAFYFAFLFINVKNENSNLKYIPSNAFFVGKLDCNKIIESSFQQIVLKDKNNEIISILKQTLSKSSENESKKTGINPFSDIVVFASNYKKGHLIGFSFNLSSESDFKREIPSVLSNNQFIIVKDGVGIIYLYKPLDNTSSIPLKQLQAYAQNSVKYKEFKYFSKNNISSKSFLTFITHGYSFSDEMKIDSSINSLELNDNSIEFESDIRTANELSGFGTIIKPTKKALHFSSFIIPKVLTDSISIILQKKGLSIPEINNISFNYSGAEFGEFNNEMVVIPSIDMVIQFKKTFTIDSFLIKNLAIIDSRILYRNNKIIIGKYSFFIKQLDEKTIYIGKTNKPVFSQKKQQAIFQFSGDLSNLLKVKGGGLIFSLLEINPIYNSSKDFINNTEYIDIQLINKRKTDLYLHGSLKFKNKHYSASEIGLFLLKSGIIQ